MLDRRRHAPGIYIHRFSFYGSEIILISIDLLFWAVSCDLMRSSIDGAATYWLSSSVNRPKWQRDLLPRYPRSIQRIWKGDFEQFFATRCVLSVGRRSSGSHKKVQPRQEDLVFVNQSRTHHLDKTARVWRCLAAASSSYRASLSSQSHKRSSANLFSWPHWKRSTAKGL